VKGRYERKFGHRSRSRRGPQAVLAVSSFVSSRVRQNCSVSNLAVCGRTDETSLTIITFKSMRKRKPSIASSAEVSNLLAVRDAWREIKAG
jgi:hypothetical protein